MFGDSIDYLEFLRRVFKIEGGGSKNQSYRVCVRVQQIPCAIFD